MLDGSVIHYLTDRSKVYGTLGRDSICTLALSIVPCLDLSQRFVVEL